jgi:hypothetical protein
MIKTVLTCPLGGTCEKVNGDVIERCAWYITMEGMNPQTGEQINSESRCAMAWLPVLAVEGNGRSMGILDAISNVREAVVKSSPLQLIASSMDRIIYDQTGSDS